MAKSSAFVDQVIGLLMPLGPVKPRSMFGGWGIYLDGTMFALIAWERLFFRVDEGTKSTFAAAGSAPFVYDGKTKPVEMPYWEAPPGTLDDPEALLPWAELAVEAARRVKAAKPLRRRKPRAG